jgi:5'-deoxynucleotidase YfbR-like HD superfamily hydrolase
MTTYTKKIIQPLQLQYDDIDIKDIAHALSLLCRANGHIKYFYSVAQHSINCAKEAKERGYSKKVIKACLLHDASEAYLSDIIRPVKKQLDNYLIIENRIQSLIYKKFDITDFSQVELEQVDQVDDALLALEMVELMEREIPNKPVINSKQVDLSFRKFEDMEREFLILFEELT